MTIYVIHCLTNEYQNFTNSYLKSSKATAWNARQLDDEYDMNSLLLTKLQLTLQNLTVFIEYVVPGTSNQFRICISSIALEEKQTTHCTHRRMFHVCDSRSTFHMRRQMENVSAIEIEN